ncbi:TrkA C-terminal domain-containing protein [bacterium]|nr:TrkA C-terminal domain-containing protein [bacterium]
MQEGVTVVSEKASDLVDASQEKLEKLANDQIDAMEVSQLQGEVDELRNTIRNQFTALGGELYVLYTTGKKDAPVDEDAITEFMQVQIQKLEKLREQLEAKEQMLTELNEKYEAQSISMTELRRFRDELEAAGGALEHLAVDESSPCIGKTLGEVEYPLDIVLELIIRKGAAIIPSGETEIESGDKIVLMGKKEAVVAMLSKFRPED